MPTLQRSELRERLERKRNELQARLERITENVRRPLDPDSAERAKQMEDQEVVDSLGNEAQEELVKVNAALERLESGEFGVCTECGAAINVQRLEAYPYAEQCMDCATLEERQP